MIKELLTEANEYTPTPAEAKLLEVLSDPAHYRKSITDKCLEAGISRVTYYEIIKRPQFVNLISTTALQLVKSRATDLINASYDAALKGSFSDRELLLEMAGLIQGKPGLQLNQQINNYSFGWGNGNETHTTD